MTGLVTLRRAPSWQGADQPNRQSLSISTEAAVKESDVMGRVVFVRADGAKQDATAEVGQSLMQIARANLVPGVVAECGGELSCATCHVFIDEHWAPQLPEKSADEEDMLEVAAAEPTDHSRLSCQVEFTPELDGIVVTIPDVQ